MSAFDSFDASPQTDILGVGFQQSIKLPQTAYAQTSLDETKRSTMNDLLTLIGLISALYFLAK